MSADKFIPYGRQAIDDDDIALVVETLRSDFLTTGPRVAEFEKTVADYVGADYAVAVANGTAALHAAMFALGVGVGDEVIVTPLTFAASANCVAFCGGRPVFADIDPETLLIDPDRVEALVTDRTKGIVAVDFAGQPCEWDRLRTIADRHGLFLVDDGCHALGAEYKGRRIGAIGDLTVFSFHPVKHVATGEGGMITTDDAGYYERMRRFRHHGIDLDPHQREARGSWHYDIVDLGYNYRLSDIHSALGVSQMKKLPDSLLRRKRIAAEYDRAFSGSDHIRPLAVRTDAGHAYHLYVVKVEGLDRGEVFTHLRQAGIGVNVHYMPVHLHPYYQATFGYGPGLCPKAEAAYEQIISLPMFPALSDDDVVRVIDTVNETVRSMN